ncbi:MAG: homoserine O-succinyltransferase [Paracoccaceae bacterium]|nr:homoserine O-succinyltransferase [Paracoccaceae bacterium]
MPIKIPKTLPAFEILREEGVMVMSEKEANRQDIRPLKIALLNLMPMKIETETQFARVIGSTPLQIELTLVNMSNHVSKNTPAMHMESFYKSFSVISQQKFDGVLITGAPIEHLEFEEIDYWQELTEIFNWTQTNVHSTMAVCWGAMAMLNFFYKIPKYTVKEKVFGCFEHENLMPQNKYMRGFTDRVPVPVSRWSEMRELDIKKQTGLDILLSSDDIGPCLINDKNHNAIYMFNHLEYDTLTLKSEYLRDKLLSKETAKPKHYFPNDDTSMTPINYWRSHGHLLYGNWINEIYQNTPYELSTIGTD